MNRVRLAVLSLILAAIYSVAFGEQGETILLQAHRGYSEIYPENTLIAIEKAFEAGADRVETDLALTKDGHLVLMHDRTVDRTTDGSGRVASYTLADLRELDAGAWKDSRFAGERVPTLSEALDAAVGRGELNLEIKSRDRSFTEVLDVVEAAVRLVQEHEAGNRVIFSSFDFRSLQEVRKLDPSLRVLLVDWSEGGRFDGLDVAIEQGYYGWTPHADYASEERIRRAQDAGLFTHIGTGPSSRIAQWVEWGVDGFSSNDPATLSAFLDGLGFR